MNMVVRGSKGGGKGGGSQSTPYEAPDNLLADSVARIIDVVSEGEIEGWADPDYPAKCIYFDDTPLQNTDGSYNFSGVEFTLRTGTPDQEPVGGFAAVENEVGVSAEVKKSQPVARTITAADVDAVRVKVGVNQLSNLDTESGDLTGTRVDFAIDIQVGSGGWTTFRNLQLSGKTTSGYQRAYRVPLPDIRPVSIRVRRITDDQTSSNISDDLFFVSYTEVIDAKLRYPNTAYVALSVPAQAFGGRVPRRSYRLRGMKCWVPSNYDPDTRTYDESTIWDGTFKLAYSNNPAFFTYTVFLEDRWGLGERIDPALVDKWRIYEIGKYCDGLVPDGRGGQEPRFTINGFINTREGAYQVITQLSATFRGVTYWGAGAVVPVQDAPSDPEKLVTNANVVDGKFNYAGTALSARKTAAVGSLRDPSDHYKLKPYVVYEDHDAIQRYGRRQADLSLPFTTSLGEGLRALKWLVDTDTTQSETVNYQAGFDHAGVRPGTRLLISDKNRVGFRMAGRLKAISADRLSITLDSPALFQIGQTHTAFITNDVGAFLQVAVESSDAGPDELASVLTLAEPLGSEFNPGCVFFVAAQNLPPRLFRTLSNTPDGHLFSIVAVEDDEDKYDRIEQGILVETDVPYILPNTERPRPVVNTSVRTFYRETPAGLVAAVSWQVVPGQSVVAFQVDFTDHTGVRRSLPEQAVQSVDIPLDGANLGPYTVHVRTRNVLNVWSEFADLSFSVDPDLLIPSNVEGFRIRVLGDQAFLNWDKGDPVVDHYHVRFAADLSSGWNEAQDVETDVLGRSVTVPALDGAYYIRAVSVFGFESQQEAVVTSNTLNLQHHNVVETVVAEPDFVGTADAGLAVTENGLALLSDTSIFDWDDLFEIDDIFTFGGIPEEAFFELSDRVDLGGVYTSRLSADLRGYGFDSSDSIFDWDDLFAVTDIFGDVGHLWRLGLQVAVTNDDPNDVAAIWSAWQDFIIGDYSARGFKFRVRYNSDDPRVVVVLRQLGIQIDMPDRDVKGDDIVCPPEGVDIVFDPPFMAKPAINFNAQELPPGAQPKRSNASRFGFSLRFVDNNGDPISASFDYHAAGYGRDTSSV